MTGRLSNFVLTRCVIAGAAITMFPVSAFAHHPTGGELPATLWHGLLSGFGHPIIGLDHFAFIVGIGLLAAIGGFGVLLPAVFIASMAGGLAMHLAGANLPGVELLVAASAALIGLAIARPRIAGGNWIEGGAFGLAGLFHGYALAESVIGAEPTPIAAYILGLVAVQLAISYGAYAFGRFLMSAQPVMSPSLARGAGAAIFAVGAVFLVLASGLAA